MEVKNPERVERVMRAYERKLSYQKRYNRATYEKLTVAVRKKDIEELLKSVGAYSDAFPLDALKEKFPDVYRFFVKYVAALKLREEMKVYGEKFLRQDGEWKEVYKKLASVWVD